MKSALRKKRFIHRLAICIAALSVYLAGCSGNMESPPSAEGPDNSPTVEGPSPDTDSPDSPAVEAPSPDTSLPDSAAAEGLPEPSDPAAPTEDFERDPCTTAFVIDRTLAEAVRVNLGLPDDMPLTEEFAASVTELFLWEGPRIRTLTGISNFTSLERLVVQETDCNDIGELALIPSLISIDISWGYITEIPDFSTCPNLTGLRLPANCVTDVTPLCKAPSLRFVDLNNNDISSVARLKDMTFLDHLCLDGNGVTDYAAIRDSRPLRQAIDAGSQSSVAYALETEERAKSIVWEQTDASMTPEEKLIKLYAYIIDHVAYDEGGRQSRPFGYWALCQGKGVCGDYAEGLCLLARHAGLTCRVVSSETHAFNAVELDGKWYLLDTLWDDTAGDGPTDARTWIYFGFTTETAFEDPDHVYDTKRFPVSEQTFQS